MGIKNIAPINLRRLLAFNLVFTILVIVWGSVVKGTRSGDGCGRSWPFCPNLIGASYESLAPIIEFSHRLSSGLLVFFSLFIWHAIRTNVNMERTARKETFLWQSIACFFLAIEALIGAVLVKFSLVGTNDSPARAFVVGIHLINTFLLISAQTVAYLQCTQSKRERNETDQHERRPTISDIKNGFFEFYKHCSGGRILLFFVTLSAAFGSVTSLADHLFPDIDFFSSWFKHASIVQGFSEQHYLLQWRVVHPIIAIVTVVYGINVILFSTEIHSLRLLQQFIIAAFAVQFLGGVANIFMGNVLVLQGTHLAVANLLIILIISLFWLKNSKID